MLSAISVALTERRIGLIGNNGSGKSSLVRLLNGLLSADAGSVTVHGLDAGKDASELPRKVGFIFQNPDHQIIFPTVIEEVAFSLEQTGLSRREAATEAKAALARFEPRAVGGSPGACALRGREAVAVHHRRAGDAARRAGAGRAVLRARSADPAPAGGADRDAAASR